MAKDSFTNCHPLVNFAYFISVLGCSMFILHPYLIAISLVSAIAYSATLVGIHKVLKFNLIFALPGLLVIMGINPLFNHFGVTQLALLQNGNSVTLEAIVYGLILGLVLVTTTNWFTAINHILTRDKFVDVVGRVLPKVALLLALSFRFIPLFINQFKKVLRTQNMIGQGPTTARGFTKIRRTLTITSAMFSWTMENAIYVSDAMQLRAYGTHKRKLYLPHRFDPRNWFILASIGILTASVISVKLTGFLSASFNPVINVSGITTHRNSLVTIFGIAAFALLANIPLLLRSYDFFLHLVQRRRSLNLQKDYIHESYRSK